MVAVPSPLSMKVKPAGRVPLIDSDGVGSPEVATVNDPVWPLTKMAVDAETIWGRGPASTSNAWVVFPAEESAVMTMGYVAAPWLVGSPDRVAVPSPLSVKVVPGGSVPDSLREGLGYPAVVTTKVFVCPSPRPTVSALVMVGVCCTTMVSVVVTGFSSSNRFVALSARR